MLKLGEIFDKRTHVWLGHDEEVHKKRLTKNRLNIMFYRVMFGPGEDKLQPLFANDNDNTFRDYGKLKNFAWDYRLNLITTKSHLEYIRNSPKLPIDYVDNEVLAGRVYGLIFVGVYSIGVKLPLQVGSLGLIRLNNIKNYVGLSRRYENESIDDIQRVFDMIAEADVISMYIKIENKPAHMPLPIVIRVDDKTKELLDKLMTIYKKEMKEYFQEHNITLGMVLDNLDLYHCLSYGL